MWVVYNIAANTALLVAATNWDYAEFTVDGLTATTQILNTVFILLETLLGTVPVRLYHVIYPMLFNAVYVMFSVVYWAGNGANTLGKHLFTLCLITVEIQQTVLELFLYSFLLAIR